MEFPTITSTEEDEDELVEIAESAKIDNQRPSELLPEMPITINRVQWDLSRPDHFRRWVTDAANTFARVTRQGKQRTGLALARKRLAEVLDCIESNID